MRPTSSNRSSTTSARHRERPCGAAPPPALAGAGPVGEQPQADRPCGRDRVGVRIDLGGRRRGARPTAPARRRRVAAAGATPRAVAGIVRGRISADRPVVARPDSRDGRAVRPPAPGGGAWRRGRPGARPVARPAAVLRPWRRASGASRPSGPGRASGRAGAGPPSPSHSRSCAAAAVDPPLSWSRRTTGAGGAAAPAVRSATPAGAAGSGAAASSRATRTGRPAGCRCRRRRRRVMLRSRPGPAAARPRRRAAAPMPSFSLIFFSISSARSGLSRRNLRAFSLPWPSWSPS